MWAALVVVCGMKLHLHPRFDRQLNRLRLSCQLFFLIFFQSSVALMWRPVGSVDEVTSSSSPLTAPDILAIKLLVNSFF